jgi:hypothetical protein
VDVVHHLKSMMALEGLTAVNKVDNASRTSITIELEVQTRHVKLFDETIMIKAHEVWRAFQAAGKKGISRRISQPSHHIRQVALR